MELEEIFFLVMKYFWIALKKYAVLEGRASRIEFWMFTLFWCIFCLIAVFLDVLLGTTIHGSDFGWITWTLILVLVIPSISISVRRLHDIGKTGWVYFINFIPWIGSFVLLFLLTKRGDSITNQYGKVSLGISHIENTKSDIFEKEIETIYKDSVILAMKNSDENDLIAGVMVKYAIASTYDRLKKNEDLIKSSGLERSQYEELQEKVCRRMLSKYLNE